MMNKKYLKDLIKLYNSKKDSEELPEYFGDLEIVLKHEKVLPV